jgi:glucose/arabinose dehydrogenase
MSLAVLASLRRRPYLAALALLLGGAPAAACDDESTRPSTGSLAVTIVGLPPNVPASVTVAGPGIGQRAITATEVMSSLAPGTYTITASNVQAGGTTYRPAVPSQTVTVTPSATPASVTVAYAAGAPLALALQQVVTGLASPVYLTTPAGDARLFIVEQPGRIRVVRNGQLLATPFLDISARVAFGGERGLLSMAFDPGYASNGFFYVYYTNTTGDITVERYSGTPGADVASSAATPVITIPHRQFSNHNGGLLMFGPDGMLYLGTGDGGGAGDPLGNGQNLGSLLGKLLRIDVRTLPYTIPPSNPFANQAGRRGEIWAYGLRNPWRFDFDRRPEAAGRVDLYIADVGQNQWEEVNVAPANPAGVNYGWNVREGAHCFASASCSTAGLQDPAAEYDHTEGCSITGGFVYRGLGVPEVVGHYFYSDYCRGWLASLSGDGAGGFVSRRWNVASVGNVASFGEDSAGELYVLTGGGVVYRIVAQADR